MYSFKSMKFVTSSKAAVQKIWPATLIIAYKIIQDIYKIQVINYIKVIFSVHLTDMTVQIFPTRLFLINIRVTRMG